MELPENIQNQKDRLLMLQRERDEALTSGSPKRGYSNYDDYMDMLEMNIISCEDVIERLENNLAEKNSGAVSERFETRTFKNFDSKDKERAYGICVRYAESVIKGEKKSLMLTGGVGIGKTHLASAIAQECMAHGMTVKFGNVVDIFQSLKNAFSKDSDILSEIKSVPMLVLDDLGQEMSTDWVKETVYSIINYRYEHILPTVITTNLSMQELQNRFGDATVSRLMEMCEYVEMNGKDYRI